jgi:hypothetical protein
MKLTTLWITLCLLLGSKLAYAKSSSLDIVMGGFYSCKLRSETSNSSMLMKNGIHHPSKTYPEVYKSSIYKSYLKHRPEENPFVMSCLTNDVKHDDKNPYDFKVYVRDSSLEKEFVMKFEDYIDYIDNKIASLKKKNKKLELNVYGHSYGGWMSMHLIKNLDHYRFKRLITVDPISKPLCRAKNVIKTALNFLPLISFNVDKTRICNEFPRDISINELDDIKDKTGVWYNFYQDKTKSLHSSKAPLTSIKNVKIEEPHMKIDNHTSIWKKFFDLI